MATGTSSVGERRTRRARWSAAALLVVLLAAVAVAVASADGTAHAPSAAAAPTSASTSATPPAAFAWLRPSAAPAAWRRATTPTGATVSYPSGWHTIETDPGTVSAAPLGEHGVFHGYLNATPQGGKETLANWRRFRPAHVAEEGAHDVRLAAAAEHLRFRSGRGSCVVDSYSTTKTRFREIACIVSGARGTSVIVAAAPASGWAQQAPSLERAVAGYET